MQAAIRFATISLILFLPLLCIAESVETHSNPVPNGSIQVAVDDPDRSDWEGIPWYEYDDDFSAFYPVDIDRVQVAHDDNNIYIHIETSEWDVEETWRVGTYLDTDQDATTGYTGNFLPVGADHFLEDSLAFSFTAASQANWGWAESGSMIRDQSSLLDVELAVPRTALGNPTEFDFILFANNFCCDFGEPDDIYPNEPGGVFTYELGEVAVTTGDCNGDGTINAEDLACVGTIEDRDAVLAALNSWPGDFDGAGGVAFADFLVLSANFGTDLPAYDQGNINLMAGIDFADFLVLSANFGRSPPNASPVPEPGTRLLPILGTLLVTTIRRRRT